MSHIFFFQREGYDADDEESESAVVGGPAVSLVRKEPSYDWIPKQRKKNPFVTFPDTVMVGFAKRVGALCGPRDFVSLAQTCRRMYRLMMTSPAVISSVVERRLTCFARQASRNRRHERNQYSLWVTASSIKTLQQVALYEELYGWGFLCPRKNRLSFVPLRMGRLDPTGWSCGALSEGGPFQIRAIREILRGHHNVSVHCDVHSTPLLSEEKAMLATVIYGEAFVEDLAGTNFAGRVSFSPWGKTRTRKGSFATVQSLDVVFVDFFFRIPNPGGSDLEFPRRHACY